MKWYIWFLVFIVLLVIWGQGVITGYQCENYCGDSLAFQRLHNGEWNLKDPCICYNEEGYNLTILNAD